MRPDTRERLSALLRQACNDAFRLADGLGQLALDEYEVQIAAHDQATQTKQVRTHNEPESLLTIEEAAQLLRMKKSTLYSWVSKDKDEIPYIKAGSSVRFNRGILLAWTEKQAEKARQEKQAKRAKPVRLRAVK